MNKYTIKNFGHIQKYCKKGTDILHRIDGPAVICKNGHKEWWQNNMLHRENGAAIIYADGSEAYYRNGELINGVAIRKFIKKINYYNFGYYKDPNHLQEHVVFDDCHYQYNKLHNTNGPAVDNEYYVDGYKTDKHSFLKEVQIYNEITLKTAHCRDYIFGALQKNPGQFPDMNKVVSDYKKAVPNIQKEDLFFVLKRLADKHKVMFDRLVFEQAWGGEFHQVTNQCIRLSKYLGLAKKELKSLNPKNYKYPLCVYHGMNRFICNNEKELKKLKLL